MIGVGLRFALRDGEVGGRDDGVEGGFAAGEQLAGIAVAGEGSVMGRRKGGKGVRRGKRDWYIPEDVGGFVNFDGPFNLAAVAVSGVGGHDVLGLIIWRFEDVAGGFP